MTMEPFPSSLESEAASALLLLSVSATPSLNYPPHMRHRAEAILKLLSGGCYTDAKIRQELGDSPDTSKALRMWSLKSLS